MTCQEFIDLVIDYCEGQLGAATRAHFVEHRHRCAECDRYLALYRALIRIERWACTDEPPLEIPDDLVTAILDARRQSLRPCSVTDASDGFESDDLACPADRVH